jgi:hypothetical protein
MATTAPARAAAIPVVAGTTVLSGSRTASMLVRIPKPVHVSMSDVRITGRGRVYGVLVEDYPKGTVASLSLVGFGMCGSPGCAPLVKDDRSGCVCTSDGSSVTLDEGTFPAGTYRVFLLADGAPVTATITWQGLRGTARLAPRTPVRATLLAPPPSQEVPAGSPAVYAAGATYTAGPRGAYAVYATWKREVASQEPGLVSQCLYQGPPPAGPTPPYQQPCSGGSRNAPFAVGNTSTDEAGPAGVGSGYVSSFTGISGFGPGTWSLGFSHTTAGPVLDAHTQELWIER